MVSIDLESASLSSDRELIFSAGQSNDQAMDTLVPVYVALDNITLHPCIDCNTPGEIEKCTLCCSKFVFVRI